MSPETFILLGVIFIEAAIIFYLVQVHAKERIEWTHAMIAKNEREYTTIKTVTKEKSGEYVKTEPDLVEETAMDDAEWLKRVVNNSDSLTTGRKKQ